MNPAKLERVERGLTSAARKVLDCVPFTESWSVHKIGAELIRVGCNFDRTQIIGILNSLKDDGLIKETGARANFSRVSPPAALDSIDATAREPASASVVSITKAALAAKEPAITAAPADTLQRLANVSHMLRQRAAELVEMAAGIDTIAIEVEERIAEASAGNDKLRQLQTLLRSIGES